MWKRRERHPPGISREARDVGRCSHSGPRRVAAGPRGRRCWDETLTSALGLSVGSARTHPALCICNSQTSRAETESQSGKEACPRPPSPAGPRLGCGGVTREPRRALTLPIRVSSRAQNGELSGGQGALSSCQVQACGAAVLRRHGLLPRPGHPVHGKSRPPGVGASPPAGEDPGCPPRL